MDIKEQVLAFIGRFTDKGNRQEVKDCFMYGCCYWFASILANRFANHSPRLMYEPVLNHYATEIEGRVYDIRGDVSDLGEWMSWDDYQVLEPSRMKNLYGNCINF